MRTIFELNSGFPMANLHFLYFSVLFCTLILICGCVLGWARRGSAAAGLRLAGHKTAKLKVYVSYTRPKCVGMLSSVILASKRA